MKKILILLAIILLAACAPSKFVGSRTGNENQLIMNYSIFNTSEHQILDLKKGDILTADIVSQSGELDIKIQKGSEKPIYYGVDIPTSQFQIHIKKSGAYRIEAIGRHAKGRLSLIKK